jgi:hypothetical protein
MAADQVRLSRFACDCTISTFSPTLAVDAYRHPRSRLIERKVPRGVL